MVPAPRNPLDNGASEPKRRQTIAARPLLSSFILPSSRTILQQPHTCEPQNSQTFASPHHAVTRVFLCAARLRQRKITDFCIKKSTRAPESSIQTTTRSNALVLGHWSFSLA